jgi:L-ascorbate metabolism protein UlaG (beta-lactamase superfamily)
MKLTYYGHSCFGIEIDGFNLLFDPFITPNALATSIDIQEIPADYILLTHGHNDHVADVEIIAKRTDAVIIANFEVAQWFINKGINNCHPMNHGGHFYFDFGKVKCVNAVHSSSMPDGSYGGNPMGFLIETKKGSFYNSGDTALTYDMKLIGEYKRIDFALLPIGDNFTMGVDNAIIASDFINCNKIIGLHYDTFDLIRINKKEAQDKFSRAGKELILLEIGQKIEL